MAGWWWNDPEWEEAFWESRRADLMAKDKRHGMMFLGLLFGSTIFNFSNLWTFNARFPDSLPESLPATLFAMAMQFILELAWCVSVWRESSIYLNRRTSFILVGRLVLMYLYMFFSPRAWYWSTPLALASGNDKMAVSARKLATLGSLAATSLSCPAFKVPIKYSGPYYMARIIHLMVLVPRLLQEFINNPLLQPPVELWNNIGGMYESVLKLFVPQESASYTHTSSRCPVLETILFMHVTFGAILPLYLLGWNEWHCRKAFVATQRQLSSGASSPRSGQLQLTEAVQVWRAVDVMLHSFIMFCLTMLLRVVLEDSVGLWADMFGACV